ncbi:NAD(P)/FAD-dependent oxidoreductase [Frankia sp. ACN1ag]|uniref:phytoene desaturase family protein n=1 Tax=Frankia sp. ACN1ag TaxID=102891 RepID=UPI0006DC77DE|nr:NAD(P)/FAD-dependent oxidoreductase [Frankia sp. ACN1ag]KQC35283.1 FAD-dependent oxidoreductase [Frankia sp. ACN1ag]
MTDAVVVGAGVNGLVAANMLADAGWDVVVCEAAGVPGGACRSAQVTAPGFVSDLFSAFHPFAAASPALRRLDLPAHGLEWCRAPQVLAHPTPDGRCALLSMDPAHTARSLDDFAAGDGAAWRALVDRWAPLREPLLDALFGAPFPPLRAGLRLARHLGAADGLRFARFAALGVRRFAEEEFTGEGAALLFAGNAMHADLGPETVGSALLGWLLTMLGQDVGFPAPRGGAGQIPEALVNRLRERGGRLRTGAAVHAVEVCGGRARGVRLADGSVLPARRAVIADVDAVSLYRNLVGAGHLPARLLDDLTRFQWDHATIKINWALSGPIPWADPRCAQAGTVHLGGTLDDLSRTAAQLARGLVPADPFCVLGQMTTTDPTRSPPGTESAWAYLHVPQLPRGDAGGAGIAGPWNDEAVARVVERAERTVSAAAPGFAARVLARHVQSPADLQGSDAVLRGGAVHGGTAALHQQLVFRPVPGLGRPETPVTGLYLGSMSAHPGGGVHGGPGALAARAALRAAGPFGPVQRATVAALNRRLYAPSRPTAPAGPGAPTRREPPTAPSGGTARPSPGRGR